MDNFFAELKAVLRTTPLRWKNLTDNFSEDLLRRQPAPNEWSALECLQHLIDVERDVFPPRIKAILAGEAFPAFNPDMEGRELVSPVALAAEYAALRAESLKLVDILTEADLDKTSHHAELGIVSMGQMLHEWGGHDLMHIVQAEQALMQPFIAECGAWRSYFVKHDVEVIG